MRPRAGALALAARAAGVVAALALLRWSFGDVDLAAVRALLFSLGPAAAMIPCPWLLALGFDALGWRALFHSPHPEVRYRRLLVTRIASDAVSATLPSAGFVSDAVCTFLLTSRWHVPLSAVLGSLVARRIWVAIAHGLAVATGALAMLWLRRGSAAGAAYPAAAEWGLAATAAAMLLFAGQVRRLLAGARPGRGLQRLLSRVTWPPFESWLHRHFDAFGETDESLARSLGASGQPFLGRATGFFYLTMLMEATETWLILSLLGSGLGFVEVLSFEASLSLLRAVVFFVPSGLGVQDAGYLFLLQLLGVPDALTIGAGFVIAKRGKELVWITAGYGVLIATHFFQRVRPAGSGSAAPWVGPAR